MRYAQKMVCLLVLVLAASFGIGGCVLLYSDFAVQRSRAAASDAAAHAQACTLLQTEIIDLQRRGVSIGDAALTARVEAQQRPAALWRGDTLVCATLPGLADFPLENAAAVTVRTEGAVYTVYASDLQGGLRLVTAYDRTELYHGRRAALTRFLALEVVPVGKDLVGRADLDIPEDMRMAEDQLFADAVRYIIHVEHALFLLHLRMEHDLKQHIAKLLLEVLGVLVVDRLADLIGLLDEV